MLLPLIVLPLKFSRNTPPYLYDFLLEYRLSAATNDKDEFRSCEVVEKKWAQPQAHPLFSEKKTHT